MTTAFELPRPTRHKNPNPRNVQKNRTKLKLYLPLDPSDGKQNDRKRKISFFGSHRKAAQY
jgi:hypothetical protein